MFKYLNIVIIVIIVILIIIYICLLNRNTIENFKNIKISNSVFYKSLSNIKNCKILENFEYIKYNNRNIYGFLNDFIGCKFIIGEKKYILYRYPDFRNEIKRHSESYLTKYLNYTTI